MKHYNIRVLILSRGRSDSVTTVDLLPDYIELLVPESEKELYEAKYKNPVLTIPDAMIGLGAVRNWVLDNFTEETIIMIDDDVTHVYRLTGTNARQVKDKEEVMQIIINTAVMAKDAGVHCFGYSQTDIRKYSACEPFKLTGWVGCLMGVIGRKYRFRDDKYKVDIDYCLKNMLVDRILWIDARYYFAQNRDNNTGGNSIFRTQEEFEKSVETLVEKWTPWLKRGKDHGSQMKLTTNVKRKQVLKL